jgi:hypothetical protein
MKVTAIGPVSNGAEASILNGSPYRVEVELTGSEDILFHAWNNEAVAEKAAAKKGSKEKKTDNIESYVYRCENGNLGIPGTYLSGALHNAAKFQPDPRSKRKSAMDLFKAAVIPLTKLSDLGAKQWDYEHKCRVCIQRNSVTRVRPALKAGWKATFELLVTLPEYISPSWLNEVLVDAGRLIGLADFRPTYGRFQVTGFKVLNGKS